MVWILGVIIFAFFILKLIYYSVIIGPYSQEYGITNFDNSILIDKNHAFDYTFMGHVIHVKCF